MGRTGMSARGLTKAGLAALSAAMLLTSSACRNDSEDEGRVTPTAIPTFQETPYPVVRASSDPDIIARGKYLFTAVAHCTACHLPEASLAGASPDQVVAAAPVGGHEWPMGVIGTIRSPNITPAPGPNVTPFPSVGIDSWTDAQIGRAIKYAVGRDGRALIFMNGLGSIDDRDVAAILSYLRTVPPRRNRVQRTEITTEGLGILARDMPGFLLPKPQNSLTYAPAGELSVARGAYLANGPARCLHCHSSVSASPKIALDGPAFAGGLWAEVDRDNPAMEMVPPNLTPSARFGAITGWSEDAFVQRFKAGGRMVRLSTMPWENFQLMSESDLRSLYRYLQTLKPVEHDTGPSYRPRGWTAGGAP